MAYRVTNGAGTSFNTAANWDEGVNTPSVHATTNITVTSGGVFSATFTAPNTTNAATGVIVPVAARGTAGNIVATLQENSAGWVDKASVTVAITSLVATTHVFFKFTTPYTFTATTAGYYRIKLNTSGASGTTSIAADSGAANFSYIAFMNSNVVPTTGDDVFIISPNQGSALTMDLDTSPSIGSGSYTSQVAFRSYGNAITLSNNGVLAFQTGTSRTITSKGNILNESGGWLQMGQTSAKIAAGVTAKISFNENGTTGNYGFAHLNGAKTTLQGADKTFKKTTLSSGVGTAASPFVSADSVDWSVGDELLFVPVSNNAANYDEMEIRFIITKNSATSYVLSATSGGVEAAFTYSHTAGTVFNLTRQVVIDTTNTSHAWYADFSEITAVGNVDLDGCRLETFGTSTAGKTTIIFSNLSTELFTADDVVFYRGLGSGVLMSQNKDARTFTWHIGYDYNGTGNAGMFQYGITNKTFQNCYVVDSQSAGFFPISGSTCTWTNCAAWACGRQSATAYGGWQLSNNVNNSFDTCESHANRTYGFMMTSTNAAQATDCLSGSKGTNGVADVYCTADVFNTAVFENSLFSSTTKISNYLNMLGGSEIAFQKYNQTENDHRWYTAFGSAQSTGAGLSDTTVRTAGSLGVRIAPEDSTTGFTWDFKILARATSAVSITGFIKKNSTFGTDDVIVELYLPGLTPGVDTPSATQTMGDDTNWNVFNLAASYSGSVPLLATVRIKGLSVAAGAYCYVDDLYNGTNVVTALDVWEKGKPVEIVFEQLGDAAAVWSVATSTLTTAGTTGKKLVDDLTTGKFIALK